MEKKNKLSDVLLEIFTANKIDSKKSLIHHEGFVENDYMLYGDFLKNDMIGKMLFSCEEFSNVESIEIIDFPNFSLNGKATVSSVLTLNENTKFKGKIYIYSIEASRENFDMNSYTKTGEDDILFTPPLYDSNTFERKQGITLFFSPEKAQDMCMPVYTYNSNGEQIDVNRFVESMHKLLDKALDNPDKYKATGFRTIQIRGYFPDGFSSGEKQIKIKI